MLVSSIQTITAAYFSTCCFNQILSKYSRVWRIFPIMDCVVSTPWTHKMPTEDLLKAFLTSMYFQFTFCVQGFWEINRNTLNDCKFYEQIKRNLKNHNCAQIYGLQSGTTIKIKGKLRILSLNSAELIFQKS